MARDFRKIIAWKKADDLAVEVYRRTTELVRTREAYGLVQQLRSAAVSVAANIAEGLGRSSGMDFRRFLYQAQGSLSEVEYYVHLVRRLGLMTPAGLGRLEALRAEAGRTLAGLIGSLARTRPRPA